MKIPGAVGETAGLIGELFKPFRPEYRMGSDGASLPRLGLYERIAGSSILEKIPHYSDGASLPHFMPYDEFLKVFGSKESLREHDPLAELVPYSDMARITGQDAVGYRYKNGNKLIAADYKGRKLTPVEIAAIYLHECGPEHGTAQTEAIKRVRGLKEIDPGYAELERELIRQGKRAGLYN